MNTSTPVVNFWFRMVAISTAIFIITMFASIATLFSDEAGQNSPVNRFLDRHAWTLMAVEVSAILVFGCLAMRADRSHEPERQSRIANAASGSRSDSQEPPTMPA